MPAVSMKSKPKIGSLREGSSLHVCQGSKISKTSPSQVKTFQQSTNLNTHLQISCSDCSNIENDSTGESDESQDDYCTGESDAISSFPLLSPYTTPEQVETINYEPSCSSPLETFFLPIPGNDVSLDKSTSGHHEAVHNDHAELPLLVSDDSDDGRCSSNEYESWDFTEFNLSKMIDSPSLSFDESMGFSDLITSVSPEYDHENSASVFGMDELCVVFPSSEEILDNEDLRGINTNEELIMNVEIASASPEHDYENSASIFGMDEMCVVFPCSEKILDSEDLDGINNDYENSTSISGMEEMCAVFPSSEKILDSEDLLGINTNEELMMNMDEPLLYLTTHNLKQSGKETRLNSQFSNAEEADWVDPQFFIGMPDMLEVVSSVCPSPLQKGMKKKAVTLVLDLDETLVHSSLVECNDADFSFQIFFNMRENTVYVKQRPNLHMFLNRVAQMFEIIVFTASQRIYAEKLLDVLDPDKKLISRRVYRESCLFSEGSYTKDLSILGVDLANIAIIDNSPQVFRLQVNNGIPIKSWFNDPSDNALMTMLPFLETLVNVEDVRPIIAERFN
ncbi:hypothetical protein ZOSMA_83G00110 [Zostera marina]|uniref:FCP1 homology domain-containing protein n=1 Tax=Zostera marina TaxID=29655 RepID=A0A0K9NM19_ZOSMR|nr:hypothetical protein ZOSMA_83G00110 [Zostera marina]